MPTVKNGSVIMNRPFLHIVSLSGGKDSTAMLLMMLEKNMPVDVILFCDTGLEFPDMYKHIEELEKYTGMKITRVKAEHSFEYYFFDAEIRRKNEIQFIEKFGALHKGNSWPGPKQRWCTSRLKDAPREKFLTPLKKKYNVIEYVGIAADEEYRLLRKTNNKDNVRHPLVEWGITEADCLQYCYDKGFDWNGLYKHFSRVSCWCCPLQPLRELRILYTYYPELWEKLRKWDDNTWRNFRADYSVRELEIRFKFERECILKNIKINNRKFFQELNNKIFEEKTAPIKN